MGDSKHKGKRKKVMTVVKEKWSGYFVFYKSLSNETIGVLKRQAKGLSLVNEK